MFRTVIFGTLLIATWKVGYCDESPRCKDTESKSTTLRLRRHLFCDYDSSIPPSLSENSTVKVSVHFVPKFVQMNEAASALTLHTWLLLSWKDVHLRWNPKDFDGVNVIHTQSDDIWVPPFAVFNPGDLGDDQTGIPNADCLVISNGTVECAAARVYTTHCPADVTNWPYDRHNCTLHFGAWMRSANEITFDLKDIVMHVFVQSRVWNVEIGNLTEASALYDFYSREADAMIFLRIELQRHGVKSSIVFIIPAIVLTTITLMILWLDSRTTERIAVISINFISHLLCILDLHWYIPSAGTFNTPKILVFYEVSLIITAITLILTGFLRKVHTVTVPPPRQVIFLTATILNSPVGRFIKNDSVNLTSDIVLEDEEHNSGQRQNRTWQDCAVILEWLVLIVISLTYVILMSVLLPTAPAKPVENFVF